MRSRHYNIPYICSHRHIAADHQVLAHSAMTVWCGQLNIRLLTFIQGLGAYDRGVELLLCGPYKVRKISWSCPVKVTAIQLQAGLRILGVVVHSNIHFYKCLTNNNRFNFEVENCAWPANVVNIWMPERIAGSWSLIWVLVGECDSGPHSWTPKHAHRETHVLSGNITLQITRLSPTTYQWEWWLEWARSWHLTSSPLSTVVYSTPPPLSIMITGMYSLLPLSITITVL